jgi:hypothetical protein
MGGKTRVLAALVAAGGLAGCASGDGVAVTPGRFEGNTTLQTLSGDGIIPRKKEEIAYRPRSPLVLPQKYELREPESTEIAAESNPAWPKDADVQRKRKEKEFAELPAAEYDRQRGVPNNPSDLLLTAEEMEKGRKEGAGQVTDPTASYDRQRVWLLPSEYQRKPSAEELEAKRLDAQTPEPRRRYLTEPPTGYRAPVTATTPEGKAAAEDAIKARQGAKPERSGILSWLRL